MRYIGERVAKHLLNRHKKHENNIAAVDAKATSAQNTANIAQSIAKGANQSLSYSSYATMVEDLLSRKTGELNVGQNIYIGTVGVPDLWVYAVDSYGYAEYEYTNDENFVNILKNLGTVSIGYYEVAMLETQKVDLNGFLRYTKVTEAGTDLNNYRTVGTYHFDSAQAPINGPIDNLNGTLFMPSPYKQFFYRRGSGANHYQMWVRTYGTSAWMDWCRIDMPYTMNTTNFFSIENCSCSKGIIQKSVCYPSLSKVEFRIRIEVDTNNGLGNGSNAVCCLSDLSYKPSIKQPLTVMDSSGLKEIVSAYIDSNGYVYVHVNNDGAVLKPTYVYLQGFYFY